MKWTINELLIGNLLDIILFLFKCAKFNLFIFNVSYIKMCDLKKN